MSNIFHISCTELERKLSYIPLKNILLKYKISIRGLFNIIVNNDESYKEALHKLFHISKGELKVKFILLSAGVRF